MNILENATNSYHELITELNQYPEANDLIDKQFRECLLAPKLGCQMSRDILPFCGRVFTMTQFTFKMKDKNEKMFQAWQSILDYLCNGVGLCVERSCLPPLHLRFPLSQAILNKEDLTFKEIAFLDPKDNDLLEKVVQRTLELCNQATGGSIFNEKTLKIVFKGNRTLCAYATTNSNRIAAVLWGIKLDIPRQGRNVSCFYIFTAAREPEYCGQNIYQKMFEAIEPEINKGGTFASDIVFWNQGKSNVINQKAIQTLIKQQDDLLATDSIAYSYEVGQEYVLPQISSEDIYPLPSYPEIKQRLLDYCTELGGNFTFYSEFIMFMLNSMMNDYKYSNTFTQPEGYKTTLQPIIEKTVL